ncbi:uncharacterized protein LOC103570617 [Microplitis demolitor]|uniref:uncharacterized protein LOC103570617 n=1 Tax=Microplitis demolitor TaxID=69319 RepID=UPI0004CDD78F|nr:uncharacterized protein LOC103570617 [Microplitis demolitor]
MLKHIPSTQPASRNHNHEYQTQIIGHHFGSGSTTSRGVSREGKNPDKDSRDSGPGLGGRLCESAIYDSLHSVHPSHKTNPASVHRHPLNHSQLSVNNLSARFTHSHLNSLNLSALSASKHSIDSASPDTHNHTINNNHHHHLFHNHNHSLSNHNHNHQGQITQVPNERLLNGGLDISRLSRLPSRTTPSPAPVATIHPPVSSQHTQVLPHLATSPGPLHTQDTSWSSFCLKGASQPNGSGNGNGNAGNNKNQEAGVKEMLTFLGLLCLVSLLLAMLSHIFLLKISPVSTAPASVISPEEYTIVYEVTLALCALAMSLNLCCLLVCAIQFLFAMKLVKSSYNQNRTSRYLEKSSVSRMCAIGGFFVSIPIFLTGMILYTFIQFHSTPAIIMSVFIGLGIIFCGCAMVHNVFVWQREKTNAVKELARAQCEAALQLQQRQALHQQQLQSNARLSSTMPRNNLNCTKNGTATVIHGHPRGQYHSMPYKHHDIRSQISPALLTTLSASPAAHNHIGDHRILTSPPATPADDHSLPTSPINKSINKSQHLLQRDASGSVSPGLPAATLDLSSAATTNSPHELSTLV